MMKSTDPTIILMTNRGIKPNASTYKIIRHLLIYELGD
jgi:hypothetical protein